MTFNGTVMLGRTNGAPQDCTAREGLYSRIPLMLHKIAVLGNIALGGILMLGNINSARENFGVQEEWYSGILIMLCRTAMLGQAGAQENSARRNSGAREYQQCSRKF